MRAAVVFGPGSSAKDLRPFQENLESTWAMDLPSRSSEADAILVFGGDGTVHRHLAQLVKLRLPVLVVPCGSGNDFARALKLFRVQDSLAAWRKFSSGQNNVGTVDLGLIAPIRVGAGAHESIAIRYFSCVGGVGLDVEIARRANRLPRWLRARGGYIFSLLPALFSFAPIAMSISVPCPVRSEATEVRSAKAIVVAAFAN